MPNIAAVTFGLSVRLSSTALGSVFGKKRSTGEPGASCSGSLPMMRRKFARVVVRVASAVSCCVLPAASCASDCATSVRVTSPTLKRSRVCFSVWVEHAGVAALNLDDGGVAQIVHVDRGCREQNHLLENPQGFARARDLALRRPGFVGGLIAVVKRLRDREAGGARWVGGVNFGLDEIAGSAALGGEAHRYIGSRRCR